METSRKSIKSLLSLLFILGTLFVIAFLQMEERHQSYEILKNNRDLKKIMESRRSLEVKRLKALRPQKIEKEIQTRTTLNQAQSNQIIHLPNNSSRWQSSALDNATSNSLSGSRL